MCTFSWATQEQKHPAGPSVFSVPHRLLTHGAKPSRLPNHPIEDARFCRAEKGNGRFMELVTCQKCEDIEARQIAVREKRQRLSVAGELTQQQDESLDLEEYRLVGMLKDHQASEHHHDKVWSAPPRLSPCALHVPALAARSPSPRSHALFFSRSSRCGPNAVPAKASNKGKLALSRTDSGIRMEPTTRVELVTCRLRIGCSTN